MYFWKIERLKSDLAAEPMSARAALPYLLIYLALYEAAYLFESSTDRDEWEYATDLMSMVAVVAGTIYTYFQNGAAHGRDFLARYFALGWVYAVRWVVFVIIPYIVVTWLMQSAMSDAAYSEIESRWFFHSLLILQAIFYWRLGWHFRDVATRSGPD